MADIIDEVIRDKKEERKVIYFKKALPIVLGVTILIVFGMIINDFRKASAKTHNTEMGDTIVNSLENLANDTNVALEGLKYVQDNAKNNAKDIAALQQVAVNLASNNPGEALKALEDIISDSKYNELTRSYAKLSWISIMIDGKSFDDKANSRALEYFKGFSEKSPFWGSAKLLEAFYYSDKDSEKAKLAAEEILKSKASTENLKEEAKAFISNLNIGK